MLDDKVHLHRLPDRCTLAKEGEQLNKLFFVINGAITAYMKEISGAKKEREPDLTPEIKEIFCFSLFFKV